MKIKLLLLIVVGMLCIARPSYATVFDFAPLIGTWKKEPVPPPPNKDACVFLFCDGYGSNLLSWGDGLTPSELRFDGVAFSFDDTMVNQFVEIGTLSWTNTPIFCAACDSTTEHLFVPLRLRLQPDPNNSNLGPSEFTGEVDNPLNTLPDPNDSAILDNFGGGFNQWILPESSTVDNVVSILGRVVGNEVVPDTSASVPLLTTATHSQYFLRIEEVSFGEVLSGDGTLSTIPEPNTLLLLGLGLTGLGFARRRLSSSAL